MAGWIDTSSAKSTVLPSPPWPPTCTVSDSPGVTDTVAVALPPRPAVSRASPKALPPTPPEAPMVTTVRVHTPLGTT